jgi:hypothetical protein
MILNLKHAVICPPLTIFVAFFYQEIITPGVNF